MKALEQRESRKIIIGRLRSCRPHRRDGKSACEQGTHRLRAESTPAPRWKHFHTHLDRSAIVRRTLKSRDADKCFLRIAASGQVIAGPHPLHTISRTGFTTLGERVVSSGHWPLVRHDAIERALQGLGSIHLRRYEGFGYWSEHQALRLKRANGDKIAPIAYQIGAVACTLVGRPRSFIPFENKEGQSLVSQCKRPRVRGIEEHATDALSLEFVRDDENPDVAVRALGEVVDLRFEKYKAGDASVACVGHKKCGPLGHAREDAFERLCFAGANLARHHVGRRTERFETRGQCDDRVAIRRLGGADVVSHGHWDRTFKTTRAAREPHYGGAGMERMEEIKVAGGNLKAKLKELIHEGNVRRIVIRNPEGRTLLDIPLNAGVAGAALLPFWAAIGTVAALATHYTIGVERDPGDKITKP